MISNGFPVKTAMSSRGLPVYNARNCFNYALNRVQGRWTPGESVIAQDSRWAYFYAREVIRDRWSKGEAAIAKDPECAADYYKQFKDQFTDEEKVLWLLKI